jgi:hypothetical protein
MRWAWANPELKMDKDCGARSLFKKAAYDRFGKPGDERGKVYVTRLVEAGGSIPDTRFASVNAGGKARPILAEWKDLGAEEWSDLNRYDANPPEV